MDIKKLVVTGALALCFGVLSSCGGGGQGPETPNVTTFNMDAAFANALGNGVSFGWMRQSPNVSGAKLALSYEPMKSIGPPFFWQVAQRTQKWSVSRVESPQLLMVSAGTVLYTLSPTRILDEADREGKRRSYDYDADGKLPTNAAIGESGPYARTQLSYSNQEPKVEERVEWSLEPGIGDTAWACLSIVPADLSTSPEQKECFRIDSAGNIYGFKTVTTSEGQSVTFQADQFALAVPVTDYAVLPTTWTPRAGALVGAVYSVITNETEYNQINERGFAMLPPEPPVDLSKFMLVFLVLGAQSDSCWITELASVTEWPDRRTIRYRLTHRDDACAQAVAATGLLLSISASDKPLQLVELP